MPDKTITLSTDETAILLCALDDRAAKFIEYVSVCHDSRGVTEANDWRDRIDETNALRNRISGFVPEATK